MLQKIMDFLPGICFICLVLWFCIELPSATDKELGIYKANHDKNKVVHCAISIGKKVDNK